MTDAPERIWALPDCFSNADQDNTEDWTCGDWDTTDNPRSVEYIRADLADRQTQEAVAAKVIEAADTLVEIMVEYSKYTDWFPQRAYDALTAYRTSLAELTGEKA